MDISHRRREREWPELSEKRIKAYAKYRYTKLTTKCSQIMLMEQKAAQPKLDQTRW